MRPEAVEQLFVRRRGGRVELLVVLETPAGERLRETLLAPTGEPRDAVRFAARQLGRRGLRAGPRLRVRRRSGDTLVDDPDLKEAFLEAFKGAGVDDREYGPWD